MMDSGRRNVSTSTAKGHVLRSCPPFHFKTCMNAILPPVLQNMNQVPTSQFLLTSHTEHNRKPLRGPLYNGIYSKAPAHWTTHLLYELAKTIKHSPTLRVVPKQLSEMQDHYRGQPAVCQVQAERYRMMQALYRQLEKTPSLLDAPTSSITKTDFNLCNRFDASPQSVLEAASITGTLTKSGAYCQLPAHKAPSTLSCQPRLPCPPLPLPHMGKSSLYKDSFSLPLPQQAHIAENNVNIQESSGRDFLGVPKMYTTENQTYGGNKIVLL
ncbi:hypothetical protein DNTS_001243 [Danionella cerebrum]|uniref:Uncharacterized protein n=1 Tax=Danionella cerebrum TaxID=2873325 RepID=A0A553R9W5_9TELE|nr:hypothetical protein DNTS_001243 [Danionella translucida]